MTILLVSFKEQNVRLGEARWIFPKRHLMRFEWFALLAVKCLTLAGEKAWTSWEEIVRLPSWSHGKPKNQHHVETNVGRYLRELERDGIRVVSAKSRWTSPYRLDYSPASIRFDIPPGAARTRLRLRRERVRTAGDRLFRFTASYVRAQWLMHRGRLLPPSRGKANSAHDLLMTMADDTSFPPTLRLVACLGAVQVLFRSGRFHAARKTLHDSNSLLKRIRDHALSAQFHLALAWSYQRESSGTASDRAVEKALATARTHAESSVDRATLGTIAHRTAGYLTKKGLHRESVARYFEALEAALITGNYDLVQASCGNIGSVVHRLGFDHYDEARRWLLLGIVIAKAMNVGREDAHGEMILAKIYIEQGSPTKARLWLTRAERTADRARNQLNRADIRMVWGLWHKRFGTREDERKTVVSALKIFRGLLDFDCRQKERYMARVFPEIWQDVIEAAYDG